MFLLLNNRQVALDGSRSDFWTWRVRLTFLIFSRGGRWVGIFIALNRHAKPRLKDINLNGGPRQAEMNEDELNNWWATIFTSSRPRHFPTQQSGEIHFTSLKTWRWTYDQGPERFWRERIVGYQILGNLVHCARAVSQLIQITRADRGEKEQSLGRILSHAPSVNFFGGPFMKTLTQSYAKWPWTSRIWPIRVGVRKTFQVWMMESTPRSPRYEAVSVHWKPFKRTFERKTKLLSFIWIRTGGCCSWQTRFCVSICERLWGCNIAQPHNLASEDHNSFSTFNAISRQIKVLRVRQMRWRKPQDSLRN